MKKQNITLSVPKDVLRKVKLIAVEQNTSVSGLLTRILEEIVSREEGYHTARRRHLNFLDQDIDLGTGGSTQWTREELHAR